MKNTSKIVVIILFMSLLFNACDDDSNNKSSDTQTLSSLKRLPLSVSLHRLQKE